MNTLRKNHLTVLLLSVLALVVSACGSDADPELETSAPIITETTLGSADPVDTDDDATIVEPASEPAEDSSTDDGGAPIDDDSTDQGGEAAADDSSDDGTNSAIDDATDGGEARTLGSSLLAGTLANQNEFSTARFEGGIFLVGAPGSELPGEINLRFFGAYDLANNSSDVSIDLGDFTTALEGQEGAEELALFSEFFDDPIRVVQVGDKAYINWSLLSLLSGGSDDVWIETDADESDELTAEFGFGGSGSPTQILDDLRDANATVEELGTENLRGVDTTHYRALIDTEALAETMTAEERADFEEELGGVSSEFPMDFWIDGDGLVRKFTLDLSGETFDDPEIESARMEFEMFDYGEAIDIQAPPADQILTEEELGFAFDE